ncbi:MAG TPA: hypothetical protein VMG99_08930 [Thermoplasmata archaeon]|nr:hypothetical protein [Thermoplasmata archaeon]
MSGKRRTMLEQLLEASTLIIGQVELDREHRRRHAGAVDAEFRVLEPPPPFAITIELPVPAPLLPDWLFPEPERVTPSPPPSERES